MIDKPYRSIAKGISWRALGTLDTVIIALVVTGSLDNALKIGGTELITKIALYFLHERLWNLIKWGRKDGTPTHARSLSKSVSWRVVGTLDTLWVSIFFIGDVTPASQIAFTEVMTKIALFYVHERVWALIRWGRVFEVKQEDVAPKTDENQL